MRHGKWRVHRALPLQPQAPTRGQSRGELLPYQGIQARFDQLPQPLASPAPSTQPTCTLQTLGFPSNKSNRSSLFEVGLVRREIIPAPSIHQRCKGSNTMKLLLIAVSAVLMSTTLGCTSQVEPRMPVMEGMVSNNTHQIAELQQVVSHMQMYTYSLEHRLEQDGKDLQKLRDELCGKDTNFCNTYTVE